MQGIIKFVIIDAFNEVYNTQAVTYKHAITVKADVNLGDV